MKSHLDPLTQTPCKAASQNLQCPHGPAGKGLELAGVDAFRAVVMSPGQLSMSQEDRERHSHNHKGKTGCKSAHSPALLDVTSTEVCPKYES